MSFTTKLIKERKAVLADAKELKKRAVHLAHAIRAVAKLEGQNIQLEVRRLSKRGRAAIAAGQRKRRAAERAAK